MKNEITEKQSWGFHSFSEKINGRIAMVAIILLIFLESYTKHSIFELIKLS